MDERDLVRFLPLEVLDHRLDALLWSAMFDLAVARVARLREMRHDEILDLAQTRGGEPSWSEAAARYEREQLAIESPHPQRFDLVLTKGEYPDQALRVIFELRAQRGIGKRCAGPWKRCPPPDVIRHVLRADEVHTVAEYAIGPSIEALLAQMEHVPRRTYFVEPTNGDPDAPYHPRDQRALENRATQEAWARDEQRADAQHVRDLTREEKKRSTPLMKHLDQATKGSATKGSAPTPGKPRRRK